MTLIPAKPVPALSLETLSHGRFDLGKDGGENGTFLVFYRGLHCPICIKELAALEEALPEFEAKGIRVVAVSSDDEARTKETAEKAGVSKVTMAFGLSLSAARDDWGLYISSARDGSAEPALFSEPGHFFILGDGTLYSAFIQTAPFSRPGIPDMLRMISMQQEKMYPPRGLYTGPLPGETAAAE